MTALKMTECQTCTLPISKPCCRRGPRYAAGAGMVERQEQAPRPERHAGGLGGDAGERRDRLEVGERVGEIVLARPDRGEPHGTREPDLLDVLLEAGRLRVLRQVLDREPDAELHSCGSRTPTGSGEPTNEVAELAKVADLEDTVAVGRVRGDDRVRRVPFPPSLRIQPVHPARAFLDRAKGVEP